MQKEFFEINLGDGNKLHQRPAAELNTYINEFRREHRSLEIFCGPLCDETRNFLMGDSPDREVLLSRYNPSSQLSLLYVGVTAGSRLLFVIISDEAIHEIVETVRNDIQAMADKWAQKYQPSVDFFQDLKRMING